MKSKQHITSDGSISISIITIIRAVAAPATAAKAVAALKVVALIVAHPSRLNVSSGQLFRIMMP